jgi:predicted nucleotide-binding protein with TIR-like domain
MAEVAYAGLAAASLRAALMFEPVPLQIPTVDLVQSPFVVKDRRLLQQASEHGLLRFVGSTHDVDELMARKQRHFASTRQHQVWFHAQAASRIEPFADVLDARLLNTTLSMMQSWQGAMSHAADSSNTHQENFLAKQLLHMKTVAGGRRGLRTKELSSLPDRLGGSAFLSSVIRDRGLLKESRWSEDAFQRLEQGLAYAWMRTHVDEYGPRYVAAVSNGLRFDCGLRFDADLEPVDLRRWVVAANMCGIGESVFTSPGDEFFATLLGSEYTMLRAQYLLPLYRALGGDQGARSLSAVSAVQRARGHSRLAGDLGRFPERVSRILDVIDGLAASSAPRSGNIAQMAPVLLRVFIGHGRSDQWRELKDFVHEELGCDWEEFNRTPTAGRTAKERLEELLDSCNVALLVFTAEDEMADGSVTARQNVIHEAGLFQGRLGFARAIVLREEGCDEFSNLAGVQELRYPRGRISAIFHELSKVLRSLSAA